jgi:DNA gyrase/topoisomerase IV subunit A
MWLGVRLGGESRRVGAGRVNAKQLIGISDIRDESSLKGVRVVFEVRASLGERVRMGV